LVLKKITGVGIGMAVIIVSIIIGIASLPDKVLIESPSFETSQNPSGEEKQITLPSESVSSNEQTEPEEETPAEPSVPIDPKEETSVEPVEQTESKEKNTKGNVIEVKISDGVGSGDK
jgi:hypothetical protein